jgi:hypothetical protein
LSKISVGGLLPVKVVMCIKEPASPSLICVQPATITKRPIVDRNHVSHCFPPLYPRRYSITTSGSSLNLGLVSKGANTNVGSRVYLMDTETIYKLFKVKGQESTFDVDVSNMPCSLNGAGYLPKWLPMAARLLILATRPVPNTELDIVVLGAHVT